MSLLTVGLTGPTGAGKSTLRPVFERLGCDVLDCDLYARRVTETGSPALAELADIFGGDIIRADGSLDRALLASRAFADPGGRDALNGATHPRIIAMLKEDIALSHSNGRHAVIDAPLLFESGLERICDIVVAVVAPSDIRAERIMLRDGITRDAALLRISAQHGDSFYTSRADISISNAGTDDEFVRQAEAMLAKLIPTHI